MTKSTITREQLLEIIETDHVQCGEASYLARIALLAMDSEQVAENIRIADALEGLLWPNMAIGNKAVIQAAIEALRAYHAQPAPVVPNGLRLALSNAGIAAPESDEMLAATCEKHIQALVTWVKDRKPFQSAPVVPSFEEWLSAANRKPLGWVKDAMREAYDACRAAMLAAAQHDTHALNSVQSVVTVPGKWIPVSERMPEVGDIVLTAMGGVVNVGETECSAANCRFFTSVISGRELPATHWMPLPAAPQEPSLACISKRSQHLS